MNTFNGDMSVKKITFIFSLLLFSFISSTLLAANNEQFQTNTAEKITEQGIYFPQNKYIETTLPTYQKNKDKLPTPIFDRRPDYIKFYYKAWQIGFDHFKKPMKNSPLIANFIDEAFNENIFLWDMSFSTMWGNYAHHIFPSINGLNNFYHSQLVDGEIVREIGEQDGKLGVKGWSEPGTAGNLNHPMLAWAELESYYITADKQRLQSVYLPLKKYRESFKKIYIPEEGLYLTDHGAMDDSPRNTQLLAGIDVAAEMVLFDRWLAEIATELSINSEAQLYENRAKKYSDFINAKLWDDKTGFYYDWGKNNQRMKMRTIAAFWTMIAKIPNKNQLTALIKQLNDPKAFNTKHRVPTHPANEIGFTGDYWAGAVWAPTNTMVIQGLEANNYYKLAHEIAINHLDNTTKVFNETGTAWENYTPLTQKKGRKAKSDFVGWSGLAPINYLIKHAIGIRLNAPNNTITWRITELGRHGIKNLRFNGNSDATMNKITLIAQPRKTITDPLNFSVKCLKPFNLITISNGITKHYSIDCKQINFNQSVG